MAGVVLVCSAFFELPPPTPHPLPTTQTVKQRAVIAIGTNHYQLVMFIAFFTCVSYNLGKNAFSARRFLSFSLGFRMVWLMNVFNRHQTYLTLVICLNFSVDHTLNPFGVNGWSMFNNPFDQINRKFFFPKKLEKS